MDPLQSNSRTPGLQKISQAFNQFRKRFPQKTRFYPEHLKILVAENSKGCTLREVCKSAGISKATATHWIKQYGESSSPRRLKVISSPQEEHFKEREPSSARILIGSHLSIEISAVHLSTELIKTLFEIGVP